MKYQKFNHFRSVRKSKGPHNSKKGNDQKRDLKPPENSRHKLCVERTTEEGAADHSPSSDDEFFCQAVRHRKQVKEIKTDAEDRTVLVEDRIC